MLGQPKVSEDTAFAKNQNYTLPLRRLEGLRKETTMHNGTLGSEVAKNIENVTIKTRVQSVSGLKDSVAQPAHR